jgi:hypothetical protein
MCGQAETPPDVLSPIDFRNATAGHKKLSDLVMVRSDLFVLVEQKQAGTSTRQISLKARQASENRSSERAAQLNVSVPGEPRRP